MTRSRREHRARIAAGRARIARSMLGDCQLCAHHCGANRLAGETGPCHAGSEARFFSAQVDLADELELIPSFAVAFGGCNLRCDFCITGEASWNSSGGNAFDAIAMALQARQALAAGAKTVMVLGGEPTIHLPAALDLVAGLPDDATLVWKTNAFGSAEARSLLGGMFDVWLVDYKFGGDACAVRLAKIPEYTETVRENLLWAAGESELIVRHLLMPGHVDCCWRPVAEWLATAIPGVKVSLRAGYWPAWHADRHAELRQALPNTECDRAFKLAEDLGLNLIS